MAEPFKTKKSNPPTPSTTEPSTLPKTTWAEWLKHNRKPSNGTKLRKYGEEERSIKFEDLKNLEFCLIGYVLGGVPGLKAIEEVRHSWNSPHVFSFHESGWMTFKFESELERDRVLENGPYETFGSPWLLKNRPPFFNYDDSYFGAIPTWIKLPSLPLECWSESALGKIASYVGDPIATDQCTTTMARTSYARVLVEVDATKPLVKDITLPLPDGTTLNQKVVFEWELKICIKCRRLGHDDANCRGKNDMRRIRSKSRPRTPVEETSKGEAKKESQGQLVATKGNNQLVKAKENDKGDRKKVDASSRPTPQILASPGDKSTEARSEGKRIDDTHFVNRQAARKAFEKAVLDHMRGHEEGDKDKRKREANLMGSIAAVNTLFAAKQRGLKDLNMAKTLLEGVNEEIKLGFGKVDLKDMENVLTKINKAIRKEEEKEKEVSTDESETNSEDESTDGSADDSSCSETDSEEAECQQRATNASKMKQNDTEDSKQKGIANR